jgi:virginiamycin B lyase
MSKRTRRLLSATLAAGLVLSMGSAALAAPFASLKQTKVPTANSEPRGITNGSDGNRWFTEGTEFTGSPAKVGRITLDGTITEFPINCNDCILTDIDQGPDGILYMTSNDAQLVRFDVDTLTQLPSLTPFGGSTGEVDVDGDDVWLTHNGNELVRYDTTDNQFTQFPLAPKQAADLVVDGVGDVWFTDTSGTVNRFDPDTSTVEEFPVPDGLAPNGITISSDGFIWFTSRFATQGVGRLDPATGNVTTFLTPGTGPQNIAADSNGSVWFTQVVKGNIARIDTADVITEGKTVKGSEPFGIVVAPDNNPWYTMLEGNKIARLLLS